MHRRSAVFYPAPPPLQNPYSPFLVIGVGFGNLCITLDTKNPCGLPLDLAKEWGAGGQGGIVFRFLSRGEYSPHVLARRFPRCSLIFLLYWVSVCIGLRVLLCGVALWEAVNLTIALVLVVWLRTAVVGGSAGRKHTRCVYTLRSCTATLVYPP